MKIFHISSYPYLDAVWSFLGMHLRLNSNLKLKTPLVRDSNEALSARTACASAEVNRYPASGVLLALNCNSVADELNSP